MTALKEKILQRIQETDDPDTLAKVSQILKVNLDTNEGIQLPNTLMKVHQEDQQADLLQYFGALPPKPEEDVEAELKKMRNEWS